MVDRPPAVQRDSRKAILSWALYDWANSAFATTVMAGFFPVFFKTFCCTGSEPVTTTARLGFANAISGIVIALSAPVLGAIADRGSMKKKLLAFFLFLGVAMTTALHFVSLGEWVFAVILYILAIIGFSGGNVFYDALLPSVASEKNRDLVSSVGYSLGYLGGGILFAFNVWMVLRPGYFGFADSGEAVSWSFVTVGIWWLVFSLPIMLFVKEPREKVPPSILTVVREGVGQLRETMREIRHLRVIMLFLAAYWLYMDGVDTIIRMAVDYGMAIGFDPGDLILALLITQFVGFPAALCFGFLGGRIGTKKAIFLGLLVYLFVTVWGAFMQDRREFFLLAIMIGLVQGGVQALSRSFYSRIIPAHRAAQYFGFYNMIGKFSVVLGPFLVGMVALMARRAGFESHLASRISISSVSVLFVCGGLLLYFVNEERGRKEAGYLDRSDAGMPGGEETTVDL